MVWICGEISNLRIPHSGHAYFSLKDEKAQISAVMFRGQMRQLKFDLEDGTTLVGLGRISVYEPRGNYQIILEYAEPRGVGALQIAFEQLKLKLSNEGLFSEEYKKAVPFLPRRIGVITSPSGSVIRDILNVINRRYYNINIDVYPVSVQGKDSVYDIVRALEFANRLERNDVLIIARGGGSLEDLAAFNSEMVARAVFSSKIPVVSAVGHETDYTISDFVADMRAPTPSAAAEMITPVKNDLKSKIVDLRQSLVRSVLAKCQNLRQLLVQIKRLIVHPGKRIQDLQLHLGFLTEQLNRNVLSILEDGKSKHDTLSLKLLNISPLQSLRMHRSELGVLRMRLCQLIQKKQDAFSERLSTALAVIHALNPAAILKRGYAIARTLPDGKLVMDSAKLKRGQSLEIQLARGTANVTVDSTRNNSQQTEKES